MLVAQAISGRVVDTNERIDAAHAAALAAAGVGAVVRYVPLPGNGAGGDITALEISTLNKAGISALVVQHPRSPANNLLSEETGHADAARAVAYCKSVGYVAGADGERPTLCLDMEGVKNPGPASYTHARTWIQDVLTAGFRVVIYLGYCCGLNSAQCDVLAALGDVRFWCDAGPYSMRPSPKIGFALKQHMQTTLAGVGVDVDDNLQPGVLFGLMSVDFVDDPGEPHFDPSGVNS